MAAELFKRRLVRFMKFHVKLFFFSKYEFHLIALKVIFKDWKGLI